MGLDFGSDKLTGRVIAEIFLIIFGLIALAFLTINTTNWEIAQIFLIFGTMGFLIIVWAYVTKGKGKSDIFDVAIDGPPLVPGGRKLHYIFFIFMFLFTFFLLASSEYRIAVPSFQLVELGMLGDIILTFAALLMEDIFFFVAVPGVVFSFFYWVTKNFWVSAAAVILISPVTFMLFHMAVYGFTNMAAMTFVYVFGLEMVIMMVLFRDVTYPHVRHAGNNLGILIFSQMSLQTFFVNLTTSIAFWIVLIAAGGIIYWKYR
jgi:hypothetical protein